MSEKKPMTDRELFENHFGAWLEHNGAVMIVNNAEETGTFTMAIDINELKGGFTRLADSWEEDKKTDE